MKKTLTLGEFRKMTKHLSDDLLMYLSVEAIYDGDPDTLHATVEDVQFRKADSGGLFGGPPVDRITVFGNGIPDGVCSECGGEDDQHATYCDEFPDDI